MFISTHEFQFQFLHFQFFPLFRGEKQEGEWATIIVRDCEGLTVYGVITTDNGYEVSTSIKCVVKECQSSKILFKSLKLAYVSSKYSHHSNL